MIRTLLILVAAALSASTAYGKTDVNCFGQPGRTDCGEWEYIGSEQGRADANMCYLVTYKNYRRECRSFNGCGVFVTGYEDSKREVTGNWIACDNGREEPKTNENTGSAAGRTNDSRPGAVPTPAAPMPESQAAPLRNIGCLGQAGRTDCGEWEFVGSQQGRADANMCYMVTYKNYRRSCRSFNGCGVFVTSYEDSKNEVTGPWIACEQDSKEKDSPKDDPSATDAGKSDANTPSRNQQPKDCPYGNPYVCGPANNLGYCYCN